MMVAVVVVVGDDYDDDDVSCSRLAVVGGYWTWPRLFDADCGCDCYYG